MNWYFRAQITALCKYAAGMTRAVIAPDGRVEMVADTSKDFHALAASRLMHDNLTMDSDLEAARSQYVLKGFVIFSAPSSMTILEASRPPTSSQINAIEMLCQKYSTAKIVGLKLNKNVIAFRPDQLRQKLEDLDPYRRVPSTEQPATTRPPQVA